jgi:hypothetical protein
MKILITSLLVLLGFGLFSSASAKDAEKVSVKINEVVTAKGGIRIRFVEMVEDSRCPTDANCVWAGNAKIRVKVTRNGRSKLLELNSNTRPKSAIFAGYSFDLTGLTPEPRSNIRINRNGFVATIEVKKVR